MELLGEHEDWVKIYPRGKCYAWVHRDFTEKKGPASLYEKNELKREEPANLLLEAETYEQQIKDSETDTERQARMSELTQKYKAIVRDYPKSAAAQIADKHLSALTPAETAAKKAEAKNTEEEKTPAAGKTKNAKTKKSPEAPEKKKTVKKEMPATPPIASGKVLDSGRFFNRKGTHKLLDKNNKLIYYLKSEDIDLNEFVYHQTEIWGEIKNPKARVPLIIVDFARKLN